MNENEPKLRCKENGVLFMLDVAAARKSFWACTYAWVTITDFYRWSIESHSDQAFVRPAVPPAARRLAMLVHSRTSGTVTIDQLEQVEKTEDAISVEAFQGRAARFNVPVFGDPDNGGLPRHLRPFYYYLLTVDDRLKVPAYSMYPGRSRFVVLGVAQGTGAIDDVDWSLFETPPPKCEV